jgi:hypothetical protein
MKYKSAFALWLNGWPPIFMVEKPTANPLPSIVVLSYFLCIPCFERNIHIREWLEVSA